MGVVKLGLRCPQIVGGVVIDPQPDWSFGNLLSEISSIEEKLTQSSVVPLPFTKTKSRELSFTMSHGRKAFIMRVDDTEDVEEDGEEEEHNGHLVASRRFTCDDFDSGDHSEDEDFSGPQSQLMEKVGLAEGALSELTHDHHACITEEIRKNVSSLEVDLVNEHKRFTSAITQIKKYIDTRQEMDRKLDIQYQRRIAEALDNHLTVVQREHEHKSQIEERKIKDDAAIEEAKRRDRAALEESLRQEKMRAEAEARAEAEKKKIEEAKAAALEAEKRAAAEEAAKRVASETAASSTNIEDPSNKYGSERKVQQAGHVVKGAETALKMEIRRQQIHKEIVNKNAAMGMGSCSNQLGSKIQRLVKATRGVKENVRNKVEQLTKIFSDPSCPQTLSIMTYAEKIVDQSTNLIYDVFAQAHVIVLISSQLPLVMDIVLAKLNTVCIYTVPKHISYSKSAFDSKEAYFEAIGYIKDDGKLESQETYLSRVESYMKLYGAIVQTEIQGTRNIHGPEEGWAWLARFLNALPVNLYTAKALQAFLEVAGFGLYRRYRTQFKKLLGVIYRDIVMKSLKEQSSNEKLVRLIGIIKTCIESDTFLEEPKGRSFQDSTDSKNFVPEAEYQYAESSYGRPSSMFHYGYYNRY